MTANARHRIALVGLGMAVKPHAESLVDLADRVECAKAFSPSIERRRAFADKWPFPLAESFQEILEDDSIGAVMLLTPPNTHLELATACARAGKHVLLEKPVDITTERAETLVRTCRDANVRLGVVLQHRFRPAGIRLAELLADDRLGRLVGVEVVVDNWRPQSYYDQPGRGTLARDGGGVLITQAIHTLDLMIALTGAPQEVQAYAATSPVHRMETEDFVAAAMRFENGALGTMTATTTAYPGFPERISLIGERGTASLLGTTLKVAYHDGSTLDEGEAGTGGGTGADPMAFPNDYHRALLADFLHAIETGHDPRISGEEALRVHYLIDALLASSRKEGRSPSGGHETTRTSDMTAEPLQDSRESGLLKDAEITSIDMVPIGFTIADGAGYGSVREVTRRRGATLVFVCTRSGITGVGESFGPPRTTLAYLDFLRSAYVGRSCFEHRAIWRGMVNGMYHTRARSQLGAAVSGVDIAVHDVLGKLTGLPVYRLLGGRACESLPVYASGGYFGEPHAPDLARQLEDVAGGFMAYKIKIGAGPKDDVARTGLARKIVGEDADLMVDINGAYAADVALESMHRIARFDPYWVEEPVAPEDLAGYRRLAGRSPARIASGEVAITGPDFHELAETGAVDVLMPDLNICGGFVEALRAADYAHMKGLRVSPHVWGSAVGLVAAMHFVAALPVHPHTDPEAVPTYVEYDVSDNPLAREILAEPPRLSEGRLAMPQGAGLGVEVDAAALKRLRLD